MVRFVCDRCGYTCDHSAFDAAFGLAWIASGRTKLALCREYGARGAACSAGVLRSGLDDAAIDDALRRAGYGRYAHGAKNEGAVIQERVE